MDTEIAADLILYNTCSIRDKAEQKVFNRLNDYKKLHASGKRFVVLGCVAQQEGERIFERAPYVSMVSGLGFVHVAAGDAGCGWRQVRSASPDSTTGRRKRRLRRSLRHAQIHTRAYITIIEGCDKFCAYCVVPYTRGKERSRTSTSVSERSARRVADSGVHRDSAVGSKREFLPRPRREADLR